MGLAAAKEMGKKYKIIIAGRTVVKLENAVNELRGNGIDVEPCACDISSRDSTEQLAKFAYSQGKIAVVINAAGVSPNMGAAETIMKINALGTINMHESFFRKIEDKGCLIDISSMSAHMTPEFIMPKKHYGLSQTDTVKFLKKMMRRVGIFPKKSRAGVAYAISKHFMLKYVEMEAARFGAVGVRVLSVSPGNFETPMIASERDEAESFIKYCAVKRLGNVDEMAKLLSMCADEEIGYLTGVDILCDGGCVASGVNPLKRKTA